MIEHPYVEFLHLLERPGRYLGCEFGMAPKKENCSLEVALAFPDTYEVGMSHMGMAILYELINKREDAAAERVFMPWSDLETELRERKLPLVSLESARALGEFDLVGFSLQHELNYTNIIAMLELGQIPRRSSERDDSDPIVIAGGSLAAHAEPMAPFIDLFLIGDGEAMLPEFLTAMTEAREAGLGREALLDRLTQFEFVMAPARLKRHQDSKYGRMVVDDQEGSSVKRVFAPKMEGLSSGHGPVPTVEAVFNRYSVEIARGCAGGCRFCQAGFLYRPVRERSREEVQSAVRQAVTCSGYDEISLAALSTADYSDLRPLVGDMDDEFTKQRVSLSVPSLRAYGIPEDLVAVLTKMRSTGVTLAPEAGSQRLRDVINKNVTEDDLMAAATRFFDAGQRRIKLYFMLGLPNETDEDLTEIANLASRLRQLGRQRLRGRTPQIIVSVSTFVPRPFTPFEREEMIGVDEILRRQNILAQACRQERLDLKTHDPRLSMLEGVLCRGDIRLAEVLEKAVDQGARFDGWGELFKNDVWDALLNELDAPSMLAEIPADARVPWDHVDSGLNVRFLEKEREKSRRGETSAPCGCYVEEEGADFKMVCHACGFKCAKADLPLHALVQETKQITPPSGPSLPKGKIKPPPPVGQEGVIPQKVRFYLAKWGRQAYVGHLDTVRALSRSLRRAGLTIFYTEGFHPKPKMEGGPPLPLGTAGLAEPFDIWLVNPPGVEEMLEKLASVVPTEMAVVAAKVIEPGEKSLGKILEGATYVVSIPVERDDALKAREFLLAAQTLPVTRVRKGKTRVVDYRPLVKDIKVLDGLDKELRLPVSPDRVGLEIDVAITQSGAVRVVELLKLAFDQKDMQPWVVRTQFQYTSSES